MYAETCDVRDSRLGLKKDHCIIGDECKNDGQYKHVYGLYCERAQRLFTLVSCFDALVVEHSFIEGPPDVIQHVYAKTG